MEGWRNGEERVNLFLLGEEAPAMHIKREKHPLENEPRVVEKTNIVKTFVLFTLFSYLCAELLRKTMEKTKVLYVSQEIMPYLAESEVSRVGRYLPENIQNKGKEIRTFVPRWGNINERRNQLHEVIRLSGMNLIIDDTDHPLIIKVASIQAARMQIYFIDNDDYFHRRDDVMTPEGEEHPDNDERAIFFARGVLETTKKLRWAPDIIHCNSWFTGFVPFYTKTLMKGDPHFANSKIVLSIYDNGFKQAWNKGIQDKVYVEGVASSQLKKIKIVDYISFMKFAIDYSDAVIQGSPTIEQKLIDYIKESGKPLLEYRDSDELADACNEFYDSILK